MNKTWKIKSISNINQEIKGYHPVILDLLSQRGITSPEKVESFFDFDYERDVLSPFDFCDMPKAVARIQEAKEKSEKVAIFGDYDADGVTASVLLYETLEDLGFSEIICYIPDRQAEGYGMNEQALKYLKEKGISLIVTVDCGITNVEEVEKARAFGMDVIVTDHHHVPQKFPGAVALINPHMKDCGYRFSELAGVGVAFKLSQALYQKMNPDKIDQLKWALDLVALGTIADCVPLLGENRTLSRYGLIVLSKTRRQGILEMFKVGRITIDENNPANSQKVAFQLAPRINAAGRMDHANVAYGLLLEKDTVKAHNMALEVEAKNQERQKVTGEIVREIRILAENSFKDKKVIFAINPHWPVGLLGLVAGKIADEFQKPVVVMQKQEKEIVGSLRSIPEINIVEMLGKCSDLLIRFGGHSQAAGLKLSHEKAEEFYNKLESLISQELEGREITPSIEIDREIVASDINWELIENLEKMEPFGEGNEEPLFLLKEMSVEDVRIVGNGSKHLKLSLRGKDNPKIFDAIGFGMGLHFSDLQRGDKIDIVVNLQKDEWNGQEKIQLRITDLRKSEIN